MRRRVLLLMPVASYRNEDFLAAAHALDLEVIALADYCPQLAPSWGLDKLSALHFDQARASLSLIVEQLESAPDAVIAVDDHGLELAALLREHYALPGNSIAAVQVTRDKLLFRRLLQAQHFLCPDFRQIGPDDDVHALAATLAYPVVLKPRRLSSSRGVVRVDNAREFLRAVAWVRAIQARADRDAQALGLLVERFIPGREFALEGLLDAGVLRVLAVFDKPDPLDGPYFEETIYVTPSRLPDAVQSGIAQQVAQVCAAAGLREGPVHAELRVNSAGIYLLEVAARAIGGLCSRTLTHALGMSLEEVVLRQALGADLPQAQMREAAGVMMIPIPKRGVLAQASGLAEARAVPHITEVQLTAELGSLLLPAPEGASYLGFIFARAATPAAVEVALRRAHTQLRFEIQTEVPVTQR